VCIFEPIGNPNGIEIGSDAASELEESLTNFLLSPNSRNSKTPARNTHITEIHTLYSKMVNVILPKEILQ